MRIADEITTHPLHRKNLETVEGLITVLRESHTLGDLSSLQEQLYESIRSAEEEQQSAENRAQRCAHGRREVLRVKAESGKFNKVKLWEFQQEEKVHNLKAEVLKHVRLQLRVVGDGLLWKATNYDRGYISAISLAPGDGNLHLSDSVGLEQERKVIEWCRSKGVLAVHHDLTICARIADLTLVYPSGRKAAVEVKKTASSGSTRQSRRLARVSRLLSGAFIAPGDQPAQIMRSVTGTPKHHLDKYCEVLVEAGMKGHASRMINDYVGILAVNTLHSRWDTIHAAPVDEERRARLYQQALQTDIEALQGTIYKKGTTVGQFDSGERIYIQEARFGAPWSIYPFSPDVCAYLTCGYLRFFVYLNLDGFLRRFKFAGFNAEVVANEPVSRLTQEGEPQVFPVIKVWRPKILRDKTYGSRFILLGRATLQQVLFEGLHFDSLLESMKPIFRGRLQTEDQSLVFNHMRYIEDSSVWSSLYLHPAQLGSGDQLSAFYYSEATVVSPKKR